MLSVLLEDTRTNVNAVNVEGKTVMHLIAEYGLKGGNEQAKPDNEKANEEKEEKKQGQKEAKQEIEEPTHRLKSILIRRKSEIDISLRDENGLSAYDVCLQNGNTEVLEFILEHFFSSLNEKIQPHMEEFRKDISNKYPHLTAKLPSNMTEHRLKPQHTLFQHLYDRNFEDFRDNFSEEYKDIHNGHYTLLQYATLHNLLDVVRLLLESGADPNGTTEHEKRPPILIASMNKSNEIMKVFLDLVANNRLAVNAADAIGNTALHHAAKTENLGLVVDLIKHGADIKHKNVFGKPPLPAKSVQCFLDKSLKTNGKHPDDEDYEIVFDYSFLVAHKEQRNDPHPSQTCDQPLLKENKESGGRNVQFPDKLNPEMDFLFFLSKSNDHREILQHPVITSFLHMKWQCVKYYFYINLCIKVVFAFLLNAYIILKISHDTTLRSDSMIGSNDINTYESNSLLFIFEGVVWVFIFLVLLYFTTRELLQLTASPRFYVTNLENILDISLIFFSGYILFCSEWQVTCVVITILLTWTEFILLTGGLKRMSRSIEKLKIVSLNYFWFLLSYILLLIAFAYSFYSLLHKSVNQSSMKGDDREDLYFLMSPFMSVMKIFIMMMGEFETDFVLLEMANSWTYFCVFALFLFIISMVLLNLLTGLAVSDNQAIKSNTKQLSLVSHTRLINEIESTLLQWYIFVEKLPQDILLRPFITINRYLLKNISLFPNKSHTKWVCVLPKKGPNIIFGHYGQLDSKGEDESNKENKLDNLHAMEECSKNRGSSSHISNHVTRFDRKNNSWKMELITIREAIGIISKRRAENNIKNLKEIFSHTQEVLKENESMV